MTESKWSIIHLNFINKVMFFYFTKNFDLRYIS